MSWAIEIGESSAAKMSEEVPLLDQTPSLFNVLRRGTTSSILRALMLVTGLTGPETSLASAEAVAIARDLAQRGLQLHDVLRIIRIGYAVLATALLDAIVEFDGRAHELRRVSVLLFDVVDDFASILTTAFVEEERLREADASAARLDLLRTLIDGRPVDNAAATRLLSYPLNAEHIALIVSSDKTESIDPVDLRHVVDPVFNAWAAPLAKLIVPIGAHSLWAWAAFAPSATRRVDSRLPNYDKVNVAVGQPGRGVGGFRRSHLEAKAVERLRALSESVRPTTIEHRDVDLDALLLMDTQAAMQFVSRYLGPLASPDPRITELRATLELYLEHDHRLSEVAELKHISRNTVTYRVQHALDMCAHPAGESTTRLRNALHIQRWLPGDNLEQSSAGRSDE
ncbi:PucR family transcriptional regulator (plasmid) [Mycolicibacterium psychrotolerans]|uniref:PucR family transcriptional regulator n=1 Tax=Mycolicibacterium psychrotolerans TaxID=216929 RepID=UPI003D66CA7F